MAKYGSFKYSQAKYGAGEQTANQRWGLIVAWDGYYGHGNEAHQMVDLLVQRGRPGMMKGDRKGFEWFPPGEFVAVLDNSDGRYDPYNTSSPLYPNIAPGKFCRLMVHDIEADATYEIMRGIVTDIQPVLRNGIEHVRITASDGMFWLQTKRVFIGLQQTIAKSTVVSRIDQAVDWPDEWSINVSTDDNIQNYYWAWAQNAYEALQEFSAGEAAVGFHSREGALWWRHKASAYERSFAIDEADILDEIGRPQPWETIINSIRAKVSNKVLDAGPYTLWSLSTTPSIASGESFYVEPIFKYQEWQPCGGAVSVSFTVNTQADGGGSDITAQCTKWQNSQIGEGMQIQITNGSGSTGYITSLTCTGQAIYPPNIDTLLAEDDDSQTDYGEREMVMNSYWTEDPDDTQTLIDWLLEELKDAQLRPIIQLEDRFELQFRPDIWDRIVLTANTLSISNQEYRIGHIEHRWLREGGQSVRTTFRLEPYMIYIEPEAPPVFEFSGVLASELCFPCGFLTADETVINMTDEWSEVHDTDSYFDGSTLRVPEAGYYKILFNGTWDHYAGVITSAYWYLEIYNNSTATVLARTTIPYNVDPTVDHGVTVGVTRHLAQNNEIQLRIYQDNEPNDVGIFGMSFAEGGWSVTKLGE